MSRIYSQNLIFTHLIIRVTLFYIIMLFFFISEQRFLHEEINPQKRDEFLKEYMMGVVKYLYQIEATHISDELLKVISHRVHEVVQFLLRADKVKIITSDSSIQMCE